MSIADVAVPIRRFFFFLRRAEEVHARMRLDRERNSDTIIPYPPRNIRFPNKCHSFS